MEHLNSSPDHNTTSRSPDEERQITDVQSGAASSASQLSVASSSSSESPTASTSTSYPQAQSDPTSNHNHSHTQHSPPAASQTEPAPTTTLWENFMASLRNVVHRSPSEPTQTTQQPSAVSNSASASTTDTIDPFTSTLSSNQHAAEQAEERPATFSLGPGGTAQSTSARPQSSDSPEVGTDSTGLPRPPVFFRLPFTGLDGRPALLAFHPQPLPPRDSDTQPGQPGNRQSHNTPQTSSTHAASSEHQTGTNAGASPPTSHSHPHPEGHVPISPLFVPFGASPLPFSFIYDAPTQTAWPIAQVTPGSPPGGPSPDSPESQQPRLVAGPPFRIILDIHFAAPPEPEQPDPEKAAKYVKQLERADAELRARMARLGMGSIGGFADASGADDQDALLGCGVCLDNYEAEDRPEWIDGPKSQDNAVVAVPCHGHHTLHAGCLRDWLAKLPPSQWTCPFCRASLNPDTTQRPAQNSSTSTHKATSSSAPVNTTLREDVRARERARGWRCDAPACLPRYPTASKADDGHLELPETSDGMTTDLVKLSPCRHDVHLDCLCTSMRVENDLTCASDLDAIMGNDIDASSDDANQGDGQATEVNVEQDERDTVGKWVTCPTCRKECWAELPLRHRPQRPALKASTQNLSEANADAAKDAVAISSQEDDPSTLTLSGTGIDQKAPLATEASSRDAISGQSAENVVSTSADPDEEAAIDAMLPSS